MKKFFGFVMDVYSIVAGFILSVNFYVVLGVEEAPQATPYMLLTFLLLVFAIIALVRLLIPKIDEKVMEIIVFSINCVLLLTFILDPFFRENSLLIRSYFWFSFPVANGILYLLIKDWY